MTMSDGPQSSGEQNWWMSRGGEVYGPYDYQTVLFCRQDGRIVDDDYVKCGEEPWRRATEALPEARAAAAAVRGSDRPRRQAFQRGSPRPRRTAQGYTAQELMAYGHRLGVSP